VPRAAPAAPAAPAASLGVGHSSGKKAKERRPPKPISKSTTTKTRSRLAVEGAPSPPTTPKASSSGGDHLLQSLGFDFYFFHNSF
jgi:hypothetical protein